MSQYLDKQTFLNVIDATPLVSIDLIVKDKQGRALLGLRQNRPAQHNWFVPGGRIRKNERLDEALQRLIKNELGYEKPTPEVNLLGVYEHLYDDNFANGVNADGQTISTHYVVIGYEFVIDSEEELNLADQHSDCKWWTIEALLASDKVHANTKAYFVS